MKNKEAIFIFFLVALVLFFSTFRITESPRTWYDEGMYAQVSRNVAEYGQYAIQVAPGVFDPVDLYVTTGYTVIYPVALAFKLFGVGLLQARLVMAIYIVGFILAMYWFIKRQVNFTTAIFSTLLLASFPPLYGNGKTVLGDVAGMFYLVLALFAILKLEQREFKNPRYWVFAGLSAGLSMATKPSYLLFVPAFFLAVIFFRRNLMRGVTIMTGAALFPIGLFLVTQFRSFASLESILPLYANPYNLSDISGAIISNLYRFLIEPAPIYLLLSMAIWSAYLIVRKYRGVHISLAELTAFFFSCLTIFAYLRTPGWYRYFFQSQLLSLVYLSPGLFTLYDLFKNKIFGQHIKKIVITLSLSLSLC